MAPLSDKHSNQTYLIDKNYGTFLDDWVEIIVVEKQHEDDSQNNEDDSQNNEDDSQKVENDPQKVEDDPQKEQFTYSSSIIICLLIMVLSFVIYYICFCQSGMKSCKLANTNSTILGIFLNMHR